MLDCIGDAQTLGKATGVDARQGKTTFVGLYGLTRCEEMVAQLTQKACSALAVFKGTEALCTLARRMETRMR